MIYLTIQDLKPHIPLYKVAAIVEQDPTLFNTGSTSDILDDLETHSIAETYNYLSSRFDFDKIISGSTKFKSYSLMLIDIMIYNLYSRLDYNTIPQGVIYRYTKTIDNLKNIAMFKLPFPSDWPMKNDAYNGSSIDMYSSDVKINYQY